MSSVGVNSVAHLPEILSIFTLISLACWPFRRWLDGLFLFSFLMNDSTGLFFRTSAMNLCQSGPAAMMPAPPFSIGSLLLLPTHTPTDKEGVKPTTQASR